MSGPYCETCDYFIIDYDDYGKCIDKTKVIYLKKTDKTSTPCVHKYDKCCGHTEMSDNKKMHSDSEAVPLLEGVGYYTTQITGNVVQFNRCR